MDHGPALGHRDASTPLFRAALAAPALWLCVGAVAAHQLNVTLLNTALFPLFDGILSEAKDAGSLFGAVFDLVLYALAARRPALFKPLPLLFASFACIALGLAATAGGIALQNPAVLAAGACIRSAGESWIGCLLMLALVSLLERHGSRALLACLCAGWAASYVLEGACSLLDLNAQLVVFFATPFLEAALVYRMSAGVCARTAAAPPTASLRVTNPRSFLPLGHAVFVTIVLLKASFGFAMTFAGSYTDQLSTILACVPALVVAVGFAVSNRSGLNAFYKATMLCVLAGFLLVNPLIESVTGTPWLANVVLRAGGDLTRMLVFLLVAHLGARNPVNALCLSFYISAASSLGSVVGAQLGILANNALASDPGTFALLLAAIVFLFVAYNVLSPKDFDFDEAARSIEAVEPLQVAAPADLLAAGVERIAADRGLTPRETEALELLAHGRNAQAIQERMVVSRSTAKTHIRNVYAKLEVHSQQELIDAVELAAGDGTSPR